jgi:RHS repeat-associated protein
VTGDPPSPHLCAGYGAAGWDGTLSAFGWTRTAGLDALTVDGQNATVFEQADPPTPFRSSDFRTEAPLVRRGRVGYGAAGWTAKGLAVPAGESTLTVTRTDVDQTVQQAQTTVSRPAGQTAYSHDLNGNMTSDGVRTYTWNGENRLVAVETSVTVPGAVRVEFVYDFQGRRRLSRAHTWAGDHWELTVTRIFSYDGWNCIHEGTTDHNQVPAAVTETAWVWGLELSGSMQGAGGIGGLLSAAQTEGQQATCRFFAYDGNGNVAALVDAVDGSVVARYDYSPFGMTVLADGPAAAANPWRFSTKYHDSETALVYYGYRYYSPELGRWIKRDPIWDRSLISLGADSPGHRWQIAMYGSVVTTPLLAEQRVMLRAPSSRRRSSGPTPMDDFRELPCQNHVEFGLSSQSQSRILVFCNNSPSNCVDPDGEWVIPAIVAAGAVITLAVVLPDWDADALTPSQANRVSRLIASLKRCAGHASDASVVSNLNAMTVTGIFETGEPDGTDDVSMTRNGRFFGWSNRTILASDFFRRDTEDQLRVLLHESYHAGTEDWTESRSYVYAQDSLDEMKCCLQGLRVIP